MRFLSTIQHLYLGFSVCEEIQLILAYLPDAASDQIGGFFFSLLPLGFQIPMCLCIIWISHKL